MTDPVLAAVDIGTNSVHMVVARVGADGRFEILEKEKEMVRLGRSGGDMKLLEPDAIDRGVAALRRCRDLADAHGAELAAVATSAVREAENRREFLDRAFDEAGVSVDVISGFEEARLIHLGVLQALPLYDQKLLLCDIGGGSTEILLGHEADVLASRSFRLGAIRLTERFLTPRPDKADQGGGGLTSKQIDRCRQHARAMLEPFSLEVRSIGFDVVVGASGTIETIVAMGLAARGEGNGARTRNAERISADEVRAAVELLIATPDVSERAKLAGVDAKRADIILGGAIILEQFVEAFEVDEVAFSDYALREGVLLDQARRRAGATLHHLQDLRRRSVVHLMELTDEHPEHSREIARNALALFDGLQARLELDGSARELLEAGALLCNVGAFISHSGHHKHSYYVIRNAEHLAGFTDREIELVAQVARYHRKSAPKSKHVEWAALRSDDRELVRRLAAILRVAIGFDRSHARRIGDVSVRDGEGATTIVLHPARPHESIELEVHSAELRRGLLEQVLDGEVRVEVGPVFAGAARAV